MTTPVRCGSAPGAVRGRYGSLGTGPDLRPTVRRTVSGRTGSEPATPWPPDTFERFATVDEGPISAGQRLRTSVAVQSDRRRSERVAVPVTALLPALGRVPLRRGPCAGLHLAAWPCAAHDRLIQDGSRSGSSCSSLRGLPTENLTISRAAPKAAAERHAFVLTYLSDLSSGGGEHSAERGPRTATGPDDAVWFRRPVRMDA